MMWRSPSLHQKYVLHPIEEDEDVEDMLSLPSRNPECQYIELYVSKEDAPDPSNAEDLGPAPHNPHPAQPQLRNVAEANNDLITDGFGINSDNSGEDDDMWSHLEDSDEGVDEQGVDDVETLHDDIVNRPGCSSTPAYGIPKNVTNVPTEVHVPEFYHHLDLDEGGCVSTREDLPFYSQFWDSSMTEFTKGMLFTNKKDLTRACELYHINKHRSYNVVASKKALWCVKCASSSIGSQSCKWRLRAAQLKKHGFFEITRYEGPHSCLFSHVSRDHKHISSGVISDAVRHIVEKDPSVNIQAIIAAVADQFHYTVSYWKAWSGKHKALTNVFGEWEPSYAKLPRYMLALQNANPGTVVCWDFYNTGNSDVRVLNYVFWAFQPSIEGFRHCRPVISIDGTHLYGRYKGKMLIATSTDADNRIFPLAFAIVDEESAASWSWFLLRLRMHVVNDISGICLISDRHPGILSAVADSSNGWAPPLAYHRYCLRHVCSNFNTRFRDVQLKKTV